MVLKNASLAERVTLDAQDVPAPKKDGILIQCM